MEQKKDIDFIEWLRKELVDMLYNDEISSDVMKIFYTLIERWKHERK